MGSSKASVILNSSIELHSSGQDLRDGNHGTQQTHRTSLDVDPTYESTYVEAHKGEFERLRGLVQKPLAGTFMHTDVTWARQIGLKGKGIDSATLAPVSIAYIPWARVQDFVKGEEARSDGPCKLVCQGTPSNKQGKLTFPRWNSYSAIFRCVCNMRSEFHCACWDVTTLKHVCGLGVLTLLCTTCFLPIYHCQYGPKDNASHIPMVTKDMYHKKQKLDSKGKFVPNGKGHSGPRTSAQMRGFGQRRGCQCRFFVKRLYLEPSIAEITYHQMQHVNLEGYFCHGATKTGHKSRFSSHLSPHVREFIMEHLWLGLSIPQIMAKHRKRFLEVCERGEELTRDLFISDLDIRNVVGRLAIETYKCDNNDAKFVRMWVQEHSNLVFHYKESGVHVR